jgi:hypothetical protein
MKFRWLTAVVAALLLSTASYAQDHFLVNIKPDILTIPNRTFYIDSVVDARDITANIGMAHFSS